MNHAALVLDLLTYHSPKGNYVRESEYILKNIIGISSHDFLCICKIQTRHYCLQLKQICDFWLSFQTKS